MAQALVFEGGHEWSDAAAGAMGQLLETLTT